MCGGSFRARGVTTPPARTPAAMAIVAGGRENSRRTSMKSRRDSRFPEAGYTRPRLARRRRAAAVAPHVLERLERRALLSAVDLGATTLSGGGGSIWTVDNTGGPSFNA